MSGIRLNKFFPCRRFFRVKRAFAGLFWSLATAGPLLSAEYLALVEKTCASDPAWNRVGEALAKKHGGDTALWDGTEAGLLNVLRERKPRYLAIVGKPDAFYAATVRGINRATRSVDDDPWTDCRWGLITGRTAELALKLVQTNEPLIIDRALCTTGIDLDLVDSALVLSDGGKGGYTTKKSGAAPEKGEWSEEKDPAGTVTMFADYWKQNDPQLVVSSSHATQFNLEMPFGLGLLASHNGQFYALSQQQRNTFAKFLQGAMFKGDVEELGRWIDTTKAPTLELSDASSRVWVAAGNCLIGDARGTSESMAVTALSRGGFKQFVGYVVPTWYGNGGWGTLKLWQSSRGQLSLSEAYFLNQQALIDETMQRFPGAEKVNFDSDDIEEGMKRDRNFITGMNALAAKGMKMEKDVVGLVHDRDVIAFWGDPMWVARFDEKRKPHALRASWTERDGKSVLAITAREDFSGPYPQWLPKRLHAPKFACKRQEPLESYVVSDDFLLLRKITLKKGETWECELTPG